MKKILLFVFIMTALLWYGEWSSPPVAFATVVNPNTDCVMSGIGNAFITNTVPTPTPIAGCRFSARIDGLDGGTGITNTTKLTVPAHKTLTIIDEGSNFSTLVVGSMVIEKDASVVLPEYVDPETGVKTGSQIMIGASLYLKDEDEDGYPASGEQMAAYAQPSPTPGHWKRKNTITTLTVDCDDTNATIPNPNPCPGAVDLTTGDFERGKNIDSISLLQGYYGEIGKDPSLVGLWHMNETADDTCSGGQDACDSSGNSNQGTATGTTIVDGLMGKARSFNGSSNYISVPNNTSLQLSNGTVAAWVKLNSHKNYSVIVDKYNFSTARTGYSFFVRAEGTPSVQIGNGSTFNNATSTVAISTGIWNHIAFTMDGSNIKIYINGELVNTTTQTITPTYTADALEIGATTDYAGTYTDGVIDEVAIYNRTLSPEEIKAQAKRSPWARYTSTVIDMGSAKTSVPLVWAGLGIGTRTWSTGVLDTTNEGQVPKDSTNLVAQWNFDATSGTVANNDAEGTSCGGTPANCDGTLTNFGASNVCLDTQDDTTAGCEQSGWTLANKKWGAGALMFDGTNDYVSTATNGIGISGNPTFSIEAWVYPMTSGAIQGVLSWGNTGVALQAAALGLHAAPGGAGTATYGEGAVSLEFAGGNGARTPIGTIKAGNWYHIVAVKTPGAINTTTKIYVNSVEIPLSTSSTNTPNITNDTVDLGLMATNYFKGVLDSVRIYSRALTASEILSNYQSGNIEMQWRAGINAIPDSSDYTAGANWTQWAPVGATSYESQIDAMDSTQASWYWDINAAGNADGTTALYTPKTKAQDTTHKMEGAGSIKISLGQPQSDANTVALYHFEETGPGVGVTQFNSGGTYTPIFSGTVAVLVVAGGGGGGGGTYYSGGGGAGGLVYDSSYSVTSGQPVTVTVGGGGAGGVNTTRGTNGQNSVFGTITAVGGGGGSNYSSGAAYSGGSGGGGSYAYVTGGSPTAEQGYAGGTASQVAPNYGAGGGGGAGAVGGNGTGTTGGKGGDGLIYSGTSQYYAGGGGGSTYSAGTPGAGGLGGGGAGSTGNATSGTANTGGGGGGAERAGTTGGSGGSGVVLVNDGFKLNDSVGTNHGTPTETTVADGFFGKGRSFNGTSDSISVPDSANFDFGSGNFSIDYWEYRTSSTSTKSVMVRDGTVFYSPFIVGYSDGTLSIFYATSNGTSWDIASAKTMGTLKLNQWTHYAIIRSGNTFTTYQNGIQQATWTLGSSLALQDVSTPFIIGYWNYVGGGGNKYFAGYIDEIRIKKGGTLTAEEITEAYRAGRDHRLSRTISSTPLTNKSKLPFWFAGDRLGTYMEATVGNSAFANYEPDANTVGLWHLEEQSGSGAYIKNSAGSTHGTPAGATFAHIQGKIGKAKSFNAASATPQTDYINTGLTNTGSANFSNAFSASAWIYPTAYDASHNTVIGQESGILFAFTAAGASANYIYAGGSWTSLSCPTIPLNQWTYYGLTYDGANIRSYINGQLCGTIAKTGNMVSTSLIYIGMRDAAGTKQPFHGIIDEARLDNIVRTPAQIREAYEVGKRTHPITVDFRSGLVAGALIADVNDTAFSVDETVYGSSAKANHLFVGDKIIVKENVGGTEYIAQGTVATVNSSTGAVTVSAWDSGSTFPTGGFTVNATVFKWQREIMDLTGSLPLQRSAIAYLTFRPTDMSSGATMWIDDIRSGGPYLNTSPQTLTPSSASQYFQLRALFSTTDTATSSSLTSLRIQDIPTPLTPTPTPACNIGCYECSEGASVPVAAGTDPNDFCQPITCSGRTWGWGSGGSAASCMEATIITANNGFCNGAGSCYSVFSDVCQVSSTVQASCGSEGCKKLTACVQDTSSTVYDTVGEICYTDYAQHGCQTGGKCSPTGACFACYSDGTACTVNGECCTGTCTTFYTDSDGDGYGTGAAVKKCGTTASGYATNNTDCNDTGTNSVNVWISATCYVDADNDNYGSTTAKSCTNNATCGSATWASGANGTVAASGNFSANNTDCNDTGTNSVNVWISATCYVDVDNDNYGSTTAKSCTNNATCGSATWASGANGTAAASGTFSANNTDCYDADPATTNAELAYPGSTYCGTSNRGDSSFDYNCAGGNTYCGTTYYSLSGAFTCACTYTRCGVCNTAYYTRSQVGCGVGGDVTTTYVIRLVYGGSPPACQAMDCGGIGYAGGGTQGCQ